MQSEIETILSQKALVKHSLKHSLRGLFDPEDKGIDIPETWVTTVPVYTASRLIRLEALVALL